MAKVRQDSMEGWNHAIEDALEFRRKYGREAEWARSEAMYYHAHQAQEDNPGANVIAGTGDAFLSNLLTPNPQVVVKALRPELVDACPVLERQLNVLIGATGAKHEVAAACLHGFLWSRGIIKLGYDSEFGFDPRQDIGGQVNMGTGITLTQFDKRGSRIEYNSSVTPGMPWVSAVLPHDFIVPWGTSCISKAPWCAHRVVRHIDDLRADKKYENTRKLQPNMSMSDWTKSYLNVLKPYRAGATQMTSRRESSDRVEYVELWEIHDARTGRVKVLSQGYDEWLRDDLDYLQINGLPFVSVGFVPSSRNFWVTPDAVYLHTVQDEAIDIATVQRHQRRISLLKFMYKEGAFTQDELERMLSGDLGVAVKMSDKGLKLEESFIALTPSNSNNQLQSESEAIRRDARETVGFSRNQAGEYTPGRHSATEAQIVENRSDLRLDRRQDALADCWAEIGRKLAGIIFEFWRTPRVVEILGPDGAAQWQYFTGSQLKGEYLYKVAFDNAPQESSQSRQQRALGLFQQLSMDPTINPIELRRFLARAFNDLEINRLFQPGVIPGVANNAAIANGMQQLPAQVGGGGASGQGPSGPGQGGGGRAVSQVPPQGGGAGRLQPAGGGPPMG